VHLRVRLGSTRNCPLGHILEQNDVRRLHKAILSPIELESLARTHSAKLFANILEAAKFYFDELETRMLLDEAKMPVLRDMRHAAKRFADREKRLQREQQKYAESESLQKTAQMLTSSGKAMEQRYESIRVTDYFGDQPREAKLRWIRLSRFERTSTACSSAIKKRVRGKSIVAQQVAEIRNRRAAIEEQINDYRPSKIGIRGRQFRARFR
jgi:hypothetical protein